MRRSLDFLREREKKLLDLLARDKRLTVAEMCRQLAASPATVRRMLSAMEKQGLLVRIRGGGIYAREIVSMDMLDSNRKAHPVEKRAIALAARRMIGDGENLVLGGGTTCMELARLLMDLKNAVVVTPSIGIAGILLHNPNIEVRMPGGTLRPYTEYMVGSETLSFFNGCVTQKAFLGVDAISLEHGITTVYSLESDVDRAIIRCARKIFILADHSKLNRVSILKEFDLEDIDCLIMDAGAPKAEIAAIRRKGVEVMLAEVSPCEPHAYASMQREPSDEAASNRVN